MNIVCIGSGYVGSVTGAAFAALGYNTTVIDYDQSKIDLINQGKSPIYEPGLDNLTAKTIGKTFFANNTYGCIKEADVIFIGVGTPSLLDGSADLKYVRFAATSIGQNLNKDKFTVIVDKSTVPIGTSDVVSSIIERESGLITEENFTVISNPEFLREGFALQDVFFPDRIVIGTDNLRARKIMRELYSPLIERNNFNELTNNYFNFDYEIPDRKPVYFETDVKSAEMIKYASNAFLAVKISYINEVAKLCEKLGANALDVAKGMGLDSRIGDKFLQVSSGWQGSCFPKDTAEFLQTSQKYNTELKIVKAAIEANLGMHKYIVEKIVRQLGCLNGKTIGILGLTFKPDTDDARKTQAEYIIPELLSLGATVRVYDPQGMNMFRQYNPELDVTYCEYAEEVAKKADCILLLTHWKLFNTIDWQQMFVSAKSKFILDTRNFLDYEKLRALGFKYEGLGMKI